MKDTVRTKKGNGKEKGAMQNRHVEEGITSSSTPPTTKDPPTRISYWTLPTPSSSVTSVQTPLHLSSQPASFSSPLLHPSLEESSWSLCWRVDRPRKRKGYLLLPSRRIQREGTEGGSRGRGIGRPSWVRRGWRGWWVCERRRWRSLKRKEGWRAKEPRDPR